MPTYEQYVTAEEFNAGYANAITPEVVAHWEAIFRADSERALARLPCWQNLSYGPDARNRIDFFPAQGVESPAPVLIAIHGGLWFLFDKWMMHFLAETFTTRGFHVAAINYPLAPEHSLGRIVEDCRAAVHWLYCHAEELGIRRERMSVLGHSAAGQLCTLVASTRWDESDAALPAQVIHRCVGISGFYDIEPFALTDFQPLTQFAAGEYERWNPVRNAAAHLPPMLLITGGKESSLLQQMLGHYADALRGVEVPVRTLAVPNECHFSVLHALSDPASAVFAEVHAFIGS